MTYVTVIVQEGNKFTPYQVRKVKARQPKPYTEPLPYDSFIWDETDCRRKYATNGGDRVGALNTQALGTFKEQMSLSKFIDNNTHNGYWNKALNKIADELNYVSNLFEAWYERREAYSMLGTCFRGIVTFLKNWRNPKYLKKLAQGSKQRLKKPESIPEAWLLYNFAIKPLVGTIDDIINLLCQDMPYSWVEGVSGTVDEPHTYDWSSYLSWPPNPNRWIGHRGMVNVTCIVKHGVRVKALNPNAMLTNTFGLTTPVSTAMSVVPWGWAVNYFINVNELISNFEYRFPGVEIDSSYSTRFNKLVWEGMFNELTYNPSGQQNPLGMSAMRGSASWMTRTVGTSVPSYMLELSYPALGSSSFANLTSAIALTMKGGAKRS